MPKNIFFSRSIFLKHLVDSPPYPDYAGFMFEQLSLFQSPQIPLTVTEITAHIRQLMEGDEVLQDVWVQGEVSNLSRPKSGHMYFTVKDSGASLRCVMWRNQVSRLVYVPKDGDQIEVHGSVNVYEVGGQYQLYADQLRPAGEGALFQEFLRLKSKLEEEGLFDPGRKKPIPERPSVIGIVTSPTGAALRDMLNTLRRRYPLTRVVLSPSAVQGEAAPSEIIAAFERLVQKAEPDTIIVGRGGGSIEDLWAFNDEQVARTIAASPISVISGVGHETDFTIADFVADLRAPTPTAAAELATPDQIELRADLLDTREQLGRLLAEVFNQHRWDLQTQTNRLKQQSPQNRLLVDRQQVDEMVIRAGLLLKHNIKLQRANLGGVAGHLDALSPVNVLERGFSVVTSQDGKIIKSKNQVKQKDKLSIQVSDGSIETEVLDTDK